MQPLTMRRGAGGGIYIYRGKTLIAGFGTSISRPDITEGEGERHAEMFLTMLKNTTKQGKNQ